MELLIIIVVGAIAGWLGGALVDSDSGSILLDIIIGIIGGFIGYKLFGTKLNLVAGHPIINYIITATIGAAILSLGIKIIRRATNR